MSNSFKFTREDTKFIVGNDEVRIVYSNPYVQGNSEFSTLKDISGILYYYYDVSLQEKSEDDENSVWKEVASTRTYESSGILNFLKNFSKLFDISIDDCQRVLPYSDFPMDFETFKYHFEFFGEDEYDITVRYDKYVDGEVSEPRYNVVVSLGSEMSYAFHGIAINYLTKKDLDEFYNCMNEFVQYSIDITNKNIDKQNTIGSKSSVIKNNRLYFYNEDGSYDTICQVGDVIECVVAAKIDDVWEEKYLDYIDFEWTITSIANDKITLNSHDHTITVPISEIVYLSFIAKHETLYYDIAQVAINFVEVMSMEDILFFKENSNEDIYNKYFDAIVNRTWMCRDEHAFAEGYSGGLVNVQPYVRDVIHLIKNSITPSVQTMVNILYDKS